MNPLEMPPLHWLLSAHALQKLILFLAYSLLSGDEGIRTPGLRRARAALSHLSYIPGISGDSGPDWIRTSDPCVISTVL